MPSEFNGKITVDGSSGFPAEAGRYHLYGSLLCPYAHRVMMVRALKGLEAAVTMDILDYEKVNEFWAFNDKRGGTLDTVNNCKSLREIYRKVEPDYSGAVSVPVLWDKKTGTIVSNDSADIAHMFATLMNAFCSTDLAKNLDLYPEEQKANLDAIIEWIGPSINSGVYRTFRATTQADYDEAAKAFFDNLDKVEAILSKSRFLAGNQLTVADIYLFPTIVRFDLGYYGLCKLDKKRIVDYPNLWGYTRDIYQMSNIAETVNQEHIHKGYYISKKYGSGGIVTIGPEVNFSEPHDRERMG